MLLRLKAKEEQWQNVFRFIRQTRAKELSELTVWVETIQELQLGTQYPLEKSRQWLQKR